MVVCNFNFIIIIIHVIIIIIIGPEGQLFYVAGNPLARV